jgi:transcriptional regulator with XRE-family HTH domain
MRTLSYRAELEELRSGFGLSERELAQALGTTPRTLRRWLAKETVPQPGMRERIEDLMQVLRDLHGSVRPEAVPKWARRRVDLLGGRRPVELLVCGEIEPLIEVAEGLRTGAFS